MADRARPRALVLVIVAAAVLAGCARIPTSGAVVPGDLVRPQDPPPYVGIVAALPRPGDTEAGIVEGFVSAMASYVPGYPTAREYLTPDAAAAWRPSEAIRVFDAATGPVIATGEPGQVRLSIDVVATLGPDGSYTKAPPGGSRQELDLRLDQVDGEWRVATPPEGLLLSDLDFDREFRSYDLYFFDPEFEVLVPDPIYLPVGGSLSTLLTEALLRGPSAWLAPAVRTAFPEGTALDIRSVPVDAGLASIALSGEAAEAPPQQREHMAAQLSWTLSQVADVRRVDVTSGGIPLLAERATPGPIETYPQYDPAVLPRDTAVFGIVDGRVVSSRGGEPRPVAGPLGAAAVPARSLAVDVSRARAAVVDTAGTALVTAGFGAEDAVVPLLEGSDLSNPSWDRTGLVWVVDRSSGQAFVADPATGDVARVQAADLEGQSLRSLEISLDGTRAAMLLGSQVALARVVRDPDVPTAVRLEEPRPVRLQEGQVIDVDWDDPSRLAVLVDPPDSEPEPFVVALSGATVAPRGRVPGAVTLAAAPGQPLVAGTADGRLSRLNSLLQWADFGAGTAPAYPG